MNKDFLHIELINRFLNNELDGSELNEFNKLLESNSDFNVQFQQIKTIKQGIRKSVLKEKLDLLKEQEKSIKQNNKKGKTVKLVYFFMAVASIITFLIFAPRLFNKNQNTNQTALEFFEIYPSHILKRNDSNKISKLKEKAYTLYEMEKLNKAAPLLAELCDSGDKTSCFYSGVALLGNKKYEEALIFFNFEGLLIEENVINWYKGLCYWNMGKKSIAIKNWDKISEASPYFNKINEIIEKTK